MEEKKDYINHIYRLAMGAGLCNNKKEFADLLEMSRGSLSSAMNGSEKHLTFKLMQRVRMFAQTHGLEEGAKREVQPVPAPLPASEPRDWKERTIESQQRTIEGLQQTIADLMRKQGGVPSFGGVYSPKNFQADK